MTMVFCRGCGKEIHSTATTCPYCGALQSVPSNSEFGKTFFCTFGWFIFFWSSPIIWVTQTAGFFEPIPTAEEIVDLMFGPFFLLSLILTPILSYLEKLPGTERNSRR